MITFQRQAYIVMFAMLLFHLGCLGVFYTGVSIESFTVFLIRFLIIGSGITIGYHRLLAHRSFTTSRFMQFIFALNGTMAIQGGPLWWVSHHRLHHAHTETDKDVHSPIKYGFWESHIGWMINPKSIKETPSYAKDLYKFPEIKFLQKHYVIITLLQGILIYLLGEYLPGTSGAEMLVWGFFISTVYLWHITFCVNSVCHLWGKRPYNTNDNSTNNVVVALLTGGEGWHNNHHMYPYSARHGLKWWQIDISYAVIKLLSILRLVRNIKLPS